MTVNGIWEWATKVAQKVPVDSLRGKTLSIDGHIWMYESVRGCESHHQASKNTYLVTFFNRIQRLRELKITPIVVFDKITVNSNPTTGQNAYVCRKRQLSGSPFTNLAEHVMNASALLKRLGVRVLMAPADGEAQCAHLEASGVTSGCITTDFDYFLYGGANLYKFDFAPATMKSRVAEVSHLSMGKMMHEKRVSREHLIASALMLGCDYFQKGVGGIGIARVFDVLAEFAADVAEDGTSPDAHVILDRFYAYATHEIPARSEDSVRKLSMRRRTFQFPAGFPNSDDVINAIQMYQKPSVCEDVDTTPPVADMPKVEEMLVKQCGWELDRMTKEVTTSRKRAQNLTNSVTQTRIPEFFAATKKHRLSPIIQPCSTMDEYIDAQNSWISDKRKKETARISKNDQNTSSNEQKTYTIIELNDSD